MRLIQRLFQLKAPRWAFPLGLAAVSLAAYLVTLPTTFSFEDSAEFVTSAVTLGIPHASGYPLYVLLAHPFTWIPVGTMPWRVALFSAVCAAAALAVLFAIARALLEGRSGGEEADVSTEALISVPLAVLSFSATWWSQAVYAKVYALHILLLALVVLFLIRWSVKQRRHDLFLTTLFFGLACANHLFLTLLLGPFLLIALLLATPRPWRLVQAAIALIGGVVGLLPYAYLYFRMPSAPYATATFSGLKGFLSFVARSNYADVGTAGINKFGLVTSYAELLYTDLGPVLLVFALVGLALMWRGRRRHLPVAVFFLGALVTPLLIVTLRSFGFSEGASYVYRVYSLASVAFVATAASAGFGAVWVYAHGRAALLTRVVVALFLAALPLQALMNGLPTVRITTDSFIDTWLRGTLLSLPTDAVLVLSEDGIVSDTELFGFAYLQLVEGVRKDVTIVNDIGARPLYEPKLPPLEGKFPVRMQRRMLMTATLKDPKLKDRPVFTTFPPEMLGQGYRSVATGYAFALDRATVRPSEPDFETPPEVRSSFAAMQIMAHLRYLEAARLFETDGNKAVTPKLLEAMGFDPMPLSDDYVGFIKHREGVGSVEQ